MPPADPPTMCIRIMVNGANGTERDLDNVVAHKQTENGLRVTFADDTDKTFDFAVVLAGNVNPPED